MKEDTYRLPHGTRFICPERGHETTLLSQESDWDKGLLKMTLRLPKMVWGTPHFHPDVYERVSVLEGEIRFRRDGVDHILKPGSEPILVQPGTVHSFENPHRRPALVYAEIFPCFHIPHAIERTYELAQQRRLSRFLLPRNIFELAELQILHRAYVPLVPKVLQDLVVRLILRFK